VSVSATDAEAMSGSLAAAGMVREGSAAGFVVAVCIAGILCGADLRAVITWVPHVPVIVFCRFSPVTAYGFVAHTCRHPLVSRYEFFCGN
jgi:hypothetical protein